MERRLVTDTVGIMNNRRASKRIIKKLLAAPPVEPLPNRISYVMPLAEPTYAVGTQWNQMILPDGRWINMLARKHRTRAG